MSLVELILQLPYLYKSIIKVFVFLFCIAIYIMLNKDKDFFALFQIRSKKELLVAVTTGVTVYGIILVGYFIAESLIDFHLLTSNLLKKENISKDNFLYVAIYISVINSLLEELFFRGFAFLKLRQFVKEPFAYCFSSVMFGLYHIFIMSNWFSTSMFVLLLISLMVAGCIFNYFDRKAVLYPSWLIHMSANLSINTIGFIMFGMI